MQAKKLPPQNVTQFLNELNGIAYAAGFHVQRVFTDWLQANEHGEVDEGSVEVRHW
jgi:hypothetical protein